MKFYGSIQNKEDLVNKGYVDNIKEEINLKLNKKANADTVETLGTYILNIDYDTLLAFDTSEIVFGAGTNTTSVLGQAILGQMVLA